jgi:hypothetical protein
LAELRRDIERRRLISDQVRFCGGRHLILEIRVGADWPAECIFTVGPRLSAQAAPPSQSQGSCLTGGGSQIRSWTL